MPHIDAETLKYIEEQFAAVTAEQVSLWADQASGGGEATLAESDRHLVALTLAWVSGVLSGLAEPKEDSDAARGEHE